jgi:hypothetical protein
MTSNTSIMSFVVSMNLCDSDLLSDTIQYLVPLLHMDSEAPRQQIKIPAGVQP